MRKGILGFAAMLISLLVIAGCGGDDSSLSQDEFEQQLEVVCNKGFRERTELFNSISREFEEQGGELTPKYQAKNLSNLTQLYQGTTEEIKELGLPEENPEKVEELVRLQEEAAARVLADPISARDSIAPIFEDANNVALSLGVNSCSF